MNKKQPQKVYPSKPPVFKPKAPKKVAAVKDEEGPKTDPPVPKVKKDRHEIFNKLKAKKKKENPKLFMHRVTNKSDKNQVVEYLNEEMTRHMGYTQTKKEKDPKIIKYINKLEEKKEERFFEQENICTRVDSQSIVDIVDLLVQQFREKEVFAESLDVPQILILTPDTYVVVDICKELKAKYNTNTNKKQKGNKRESQVVVQKLFSKHISIEEHQELLNPTKDGGQYINIFVGTPNRVKKLVELGSIKVTSSKFKFMIIDSNLNKKNFSIFDVVETRDDVFDTLVLAHKRFLKRKLKVYVS